MTEDKKVNVAIVGCGNIGLETARLLCGRHSLVLINHSCPSELAEWIHRHGDVSFVPADATNPQDMEAALQTFYRRFNKLDALLGTVGAACSASAIDDFDGYEREFLLNVLGNLVPLQTVLARMIPQREGRLVIVSSTSGVFTYPGLTAYAPAKWAVTNLCRVLRREITGNGISLGILFPRTIRNRRSRTFLSEKGIEPETVARAAAAMLGYGSDADRFIPGRYVLLRPLEQLLPGVLDARAGLHRGRKRRLRRRRARRVLITGAASGLGRELARLYGQSAERVCLADRDPGTLAEMKTLMTRSSNCAIDVIGYDPADKLSVGKCGAEVRDPDLVINVVGCGPARRFQDMTPEQCEADLRTGCLGPARLISTLLARQTGPGKILNVLSASAIRAQPGCACWAAGHAALWAFTRALRRTCGNDLQVMEAIVDRCPSGSADGCNGKGSNLCAERNKPACSAAEVAASHPSDKRIAERIVQAERSGGEIIAFPLGLRLSTCFDGVFRH